MMFVNVNWLYLNVEVKFIFYRNSKRWEAKANKKKIKDSFLELIAVQALVHEIHVKLIEIKNLTPLTSASIQGTSDHNKSNLPEMVKKHKIH